MNILRLWIGLPCAVAIVLCATATQAFQQTQPPRFRAEVAAVLVDVLVLDEQGQPVGGLTGDDFEIYEDGVLQEIQNFDMIDWESYVAREAPVEGKLRPAPPTASVNAFPRRFIFIINRQGAEFSFMVRAKRALESFVVESMADGDEAMVVDIGMSTRIIQQFTSSKEETLRAVKKLYPMRADIFYGTHIATRNVYDTLESLGQGLGGFPGRKVVLFMSPELNRTRDLLLDLQNTVDALNQSNTTVYSIDIEGALSGARADQGPIDPALDDVGALSGSLDSFEIGGLFPLANETGGRYYYNLNTFEPTVRRIGEENRRYYLLTYTPLNDMLDGKYRRIEVRVKRPGITVKARKGYFARKAEEPVVADENTSPPHPSPEPSPTPADKPRQEPLPTGGAPARPPSQVEITNYLFPAAEGKVEVPIAVALPLDLFSGKGGERGSRTLKLTLGDGSGKTLASFSGEVDAANFSLIRSAHLDPGSYLLQITLEDSGEVVYQSSTQVDVPSGFGDRFGLSSIAPILPPSSEDPPAEGPPIRPTSTLRLGEDLFVHFRIFPGQRGEPSKSVQVVYSIYRGEEEVQSLRQPDLELEKSQDTGFPVVARLPTSKLPPGEYRILVRVSDPKLGRRATGEFGLTIAR